MRRLSAILALSIGVSALSAFTLGAAADPVSRYETRRHLYFVGLGMLPIIAPDREEPGDIYKTMNGPILMRRATCFKTNLNVSAHAPFSFPNLSYSDGRSIGGSAFIDLEAIFAFLNLSATGDFRMTLRLNDATSRSIEEHSVSKALQMPRNKECLDNFRRTISGQMQGGDEERILWVLLRVFYAKESLLVESLRSFDASLAATIEATVKQFPLAADASIEGSVLSRGSLTVSSRRSLPVAWRPAYVSKEDWEALRRWREWGIVSFLMQLFSGQTSKQIAVSTILHKFPGFLTRPSEVERQMSSGTPKDFNESEKGDLEYLDLANMRMALALDYYGTR